MLIILHPCSSRFPRRAPKLTSPYIHVPALRPSPTKSYCTLSNSYSTVCVPKHTILGPGCTDRVSHSHSVIDASTRPIHAACVHAILSASAAVGRRVPQWDRVPSHSGTEYPSMSTVPGPVTHVQTQRSQLTVSFSCSLSQTTPSLDCSCYFTQPQSPNSIFLISQRVEISVPETVLRAIIDV